MKIAFISQFYWQDSQFHEEEGGATRQLVEAVAALGHEVIILSQSSEVRKLRKAKYGTLETWISPREKHRDLITAVRDRLSAKTYAHKSAHSDALVLKQFLAERGPFDAIWAHAESPDGLSLALAAQLGVKLPPVLLQVQKLRCRYEKGAPVFTEKKPLALAFRLAKRILAVSPLIAEHLQKYAGPEIAASALKDKTYVVYPNIQRAFLRAAAENPAKFQAMKDRILYLGALDHHKGVLIFLRALPKTELSKRSSSIAVIGDFTEDDKHFVQLWEQTREFSRKGIRGARVEYLNRVSVGEVIRQIRLAHAVVIPSLFDSFGRGVVESLILGRPVITTDGVGSSPLVRQNDCGIIVPANDVDALAQAIDAIMSPIVPFDENARRLNDHLAQFFSPETIAQQIDGHLREITAN